MYLLLNEKEKLVFETIKDFEDYDLKQYKVYSLSPIDPSGLIIDGEIRDRIYSVLKDNEMTKNEIIDKVTMWVDASKSKISKIITQMKREKIICAIDDWNYMGERFLRINKGELY